MDNKKSIDEARKILIDNGWSVYQDLLFEGKNIEGFNWVGPRGEEKYSIGYWNEDPTLFEGFEDYLGEKAVEEYYTRDEKQIIHPDGWHCYVTQSSDEMVVIGYRELQDGKFVDCIDHIRVPVEFAKPLAEALQYFADKHLTKEQ